MFPDLAFYKTNKSTLLLCVLDKMKLHGYSYSMPQVYFEVMLNACQWLHQCAKVHRFSKKLFDSLFNNQTLSYEFSKQINLFSHVVTWFEMGKQELKMTDKVFASDDILQMKLPLVLLRLSFSQINQHFKDWYQKSATKEIEFLIKITNTSSWKDKLSSE